MSGRHGRHQVQQRRRTGSVIVFLVALAVFVVAGYMLVSQLLEYYRGEQEYESIAGLLDDVTSEQTQQTLQNEDSAQELLNDDTYIEAWREKMDSLSQTNEDLVGWIWIPDTNINYPVVQAADNDYYLTHTFNRNQHSSGAIFMDYQNQANFTDDNTVLHGHHMKNGSMFHDLVNFRKQSFADEHPYVYLVHPDGKIDRYGIYACYVTPATSDYTRQFFVSEEEKMDYIYWTVSQSEIKMDYALSSGDHILTLSTCAYDYDNARCTVQAVLLDQMGTVLPDADATGTP